MPLTSGSLAEATKLYSLTVVMPEVSGFSAPPPASCLSSSLENCPPPPPGIAAPYRQIATPMSPATTRKTAT